MIRIITYHLFCLLFVANISAQITANFTAQECTKVLYYQGFDSAELMSDWKIISTNTAKTWHPDNSKKAGIPNFNSINPSSLFSITVFHDKTNQNETLISPDIFIPLNSFCSFYACFDGVYIMWANLTIDVVEKESQVKNKLFDAFEWSQENGHERPKWLPFSFDLSNYAGKKVQFIFTYKGTDGDDVMIDDFQIIQKVDDETSKVEINEGKNVHFEDISTGNPTSWKWSFEGGEPSVSTEQNPVITYNTAGTYPVKLMAKNASAYNECIRNAFVVVKAAAPVAGIHFPEGGYLSPYAGFFIPANTEVQFTDASLNRPTSWLWSLPGSSHPTSKEQSPIVSYTQEGTFDISLQSSNSAGTDLLDYEKVIQAGGTQYIWNIGMDESSNLAAVPLGWFGYYGGTNWLGMKAFAELFDKPAIKGSISEVSVFFDKTATITPDTLITVSISKSEKRLPGQKIASASIPAKELKYSPDDWLATVFKFKEPIEVTDSFFIVIEGIPNNSSKAGTDDIAIASTTTRPDGGKSTVYHLLEEWDENDLPTGKTEWIKNSDEFLSFAIAPKFTFISTGNYITDLSAEQKTLLCPTKVKGIINLFEPEKLQDLSIWSVTGQLVYTSGQIFAPIDTSEWDQGFYVLKVQTTKGRSVQKIWIEK